jgi:hypothetical protein
MESGTPVYVAKITFDSIDITVSRITTYGFSVLYKEGSTNNWKHRNTLYTWYFDGAFPVLTPTFNSTTVVYTDTTDNGIVDLQLISSPDAGVQVILPTYESTQETISSGIYISNGGTWRFLSFSDQGIDPITATNKVTVIALDQTNEGIYIFRNDTTNNEIALYKGIVLAQQVTLVKNGQEGLIYYPYVPKLEISVPLIPSLDANKDLGAIGLQFRDIYFSGSLYNNGAPFSPTGLTYRATGPTGPTGGPTGPTGPTLQVAAHLVPNVDLAYDLGATGLRFRDIHVGGSTIYLGDSVSITATTEGSLNVTNTQGSVSLLTPTGFNGGILSGAGITSTGPSGSTGEYYGDERFYPPFAFPPIVVASINDVSYISSKLYIPENTVTATGCRIYSDAIGTSYNWIATARTNYPFSFYSVTPITEVSVTSTSLILSINTSLLVRGGVLPYTTVEMRAFETPTFTAIPITINTGVQTITIGSLTADSSYDIYISVTDSSDTPTTIETTIQTFSTAS